jgi:prepilin-type N-terminal cleavage/methylation domain-containing protein
MTGNGSSTLPRHAAEAGFTAAELMVVVGVIGLLAAISVASLVSFARASALRAGAEEMATVLHRARQLAIKDNTAVCVANAGARVQLRIASCGGLAWVGPGSDAGGFIRLANNITVVSPRDVMFTYLGTATPAGTYTVIHPQDGRSLRVNVALSGRVSIRP